MMNGLRLELMAPAFLPHSDICLSQRVIIQGDRQLKEMDHEPGFCDAILHTGKVQLQEDQVRFQV